MTTAHRHPTASPRSAAAAPSARLAWACALCAAACVATAAVYAQPPAAACKPAPIEQLKAAYLACADHTARHRMDEALAQHCGAIGEQLKQRAFDGDFDRLIAWWQRERDAATPLAAIDVPLACAAPLPATHAARARSTRDSRPDTRSPA